MGKGGFKARMMVTMGKMIISPDLIEKWEKYVKDAIANEFTQGQQIYPVLKAVRNLKKGLTLDIVINELRKDGMDGNMFWLVLNEIAQFSDRGNEVEKYVLMARARQIIEPTLIQEWEEVVDTSMEMDFTRGSELHPILNAIEALKEGSTLEEVINGLRKDGIDGNMFWGVLYPIARFSSRGEEVKMYIVKNKASLIIAPELMSQWENLVKDTNGNENAMNASQLDAVLDVVRDLKNNLTLEEVIKRLRKGGIEGSVLETVLAQATMFSDRADDIRQYQANRTAQEGGVIALYNETKGLTEELCRIDGEITTVLHNLSSRNDDKLVTAEK